MTIQPVALPTTEITFNYDHTSTHITIMADEARAQAQLADFPSLFSLKGKVAVVTGGSRGLGLHAASA